MAPPISHTCQPLKRISQVVGHLSMLLRELHIAFTFWGSPSMTGVRDAHQFIKERTSCAFPFLNIDNAYWEVDKSCVVDAVSKAADIVQKKTQNQGRFRFSIAKGGLKCPDRVGKASDKGFRTVSLDKVLFFVKWDIHHNNSLSLWGVIMKPTKERSPHRGFMQGWFHPEHKLLFIVPFGDTTAPVYAMGRWDSHPEGRVGKTIDRSVRSQRKFLLQCFQDPSPLKLLLLCDAILLPPPSRNSPSRIKPTNLCAFVCGSTNGGNTPQ